MKLSNIKGFSLLETMLAVAISSVIALSITYAVVGSLDGMSHVKNLSLAEEASQLMSGILVDSNYCGLHFNGKTVPLAMGTVFEPNVVFKEMATPTSLGPNTIFGAGTKYQNVLLINSMKLLVESKISAQRYIGSIQVDYKANTGLQSQFSRKVNLILETDAARKITSCSHSSSSAIMAAQYVKGQAYGYCKMDLNASFTITYATPAKWPVLTCPNSGPLVAPTCDVGFSPIVTIQSQGNVRDSAMMSAVPISMDPRVDLRRVIGDFADGDMYIIGWACIKD